MFAEHVEKLTRARFFFFLKDATRFPPGALDCPARSQNLRLNSESRDALMRSLQKN